MSGMTKAKSAMGLNITLAAGDSAATDITIAGIATTDTIIFVGHFSTLAVIATVVDDTANVTITAANTIRSATDTSNDQLFVVWNDNSI